MSVVSDGSHDVLVVDAQTDEDDNVHLELAIVAGPHKGEVVRLRATGMHGDAIGMLGLPATLHVENGTPSVVFDDEI